MDIRIGVGTERTALPVTLGLVAIRESGGDPARIGNREYAIIQQMTNLMAKR